jgi:hypothetical protein
MGNSPQIVSSRKITTEPAGVLGHAGFERSDLRGLLLDDREQMDDQLAHDERCLFPTAGIKRKPCGKWERRRHRYPS